MSRDTLWKEGEERNPKMRRVRGFRSEGLAFAVIPRIHSFLHLQGQCEKVRKEMGVSLRLARYPESQLGQVADSHPTLTLAQLKPSVVKHSGSRGKVRLVPSLIFLIASLPPRPS